MLQVKNGAGSQSTPEEGKEFKTKLLIKLESLEEIILTIKGEKRHRAIETYRELLWLLKDEPIYLSRYE
jgi:hypothetical protein